MNRSRIIIYIFISLKWIEYLGRSYLRYRQLLTLQTDTPYVQYVEKTFYTETKLQQIRTTEIAKLKFWLVYDLTNKIYETIILVFNLRHKLWKFSARLVGFTESSLTLQNEIVISVVYLIGFFFVKDVLNSPGVFCYSHQILGKSLDSQVIVEFIRKNYLTLMLIPANIVLWDLPRIVIVRLGGYYRFFYLGIFSSVGSIAIIVFRAYMELLKVTESVVPFDDALQPKIDNLSHLSGFPRENIHLTDSATANTSSTAFSLGVFSSAIILHGPLFHRSKQQTDNHLQLTDDEIVAIVAHEMGHWYHLHSLRTVVNLTVGILVECIFYHILFNCAILYEGFNFHESKPVIIGFIIIHNYVLVPYHYVKDFINVLIGRRFETESDSYCIHLTKNVAALSEALIKLDVDNNVYPIEDYYHELFRNRQGSSFDRVNTVAWQSDG